MDGIKEGDDNDFEIRKADAMIAMLVLEKKGIKQKWLAEKQGKSYNMANSYVQNRQQPRLEVLYNIVDILNVEVKDLLIEGKATK